MYTTIIDVNIKYNSLNRLLLTMLMSEKSDNLMYKETIPHFLIAHSQTLSRA